MKQWLVIPIALFSLSQLTGCGNEQSNTDSIEQLNSSNHLIISNSNTTSIINKDTAYDLIISGNLNKITIEKSNTVDTLIVSGANNEIIISELSLISNIELKGNGNTLFFDGESTTSMFTVSGTQNIISVPRHSQINVPSLSIDNEWRRHTTHEIVGTWIQNQKENEALTCVDSFTLNTDGSFNYQSGDNVLTGTYTFQKTIFNNARHKLELSYTENNGLPNCKNESGGEIGTTIAWYVLFFDYAPGFMDVYDKLDEVEAETPFIIFNPLIPITQ